MMVKRLATAALIAGLGLGIAGCAQDNYGYGGLAVGYGAPGYYDGYGPYGGYGAYGGYGYPGYFGWYDGFYYPGSGFYVYDQFHRPYRWNDGQRHYWEGRRGGYSGQGNWAGFAHQQVGVGQAGFGGGARFAGGQGFRGSPGGGSRAGGQSFRGGAGGGGHGGGGGGHHR